MAAMQLALWMLALPVVTTVLCIYFWKRPPTKRRALVATLVPLPIFLLPGHLCDAGDATIQKLVGGLCVIFVVTCATDRRVAAALGVIFLLATIGLVSHYERLVHGSQFIGRRGDRWSSQMQRRRQAREVGEILRSEPAWTSTPIREGWLSDDPRATLELKRMLTGTRETGVPYWHSIYTRLYALLRIPVEIQYPGGPVESGAGNLEWRDRP